MIKRGLKFFRPFFPNQLMDNFLILGRKLWWSILLPTQINHFTWVTCEITFWVIVLLKFLKQMVIRFTKYRSLTIGVYTFANRWLHGNYLVMEKHLQAAA